MKNEDKIAELLAVYLKKTDRSLDQLKEQSKEISKQQKILEAQQKTLDANQKILTKHNSTLVSHNKNIELAYDILIQHSEEMAVLRKEASKESKKWEIRHDVLLKEIFAISKRVQTLEEKK